MDAEKRNECLKTRLQSCQNAEEAARFEEPQAAVLRSL